MLALPVIARAALTGRLDSQAIGGVRSWVADRAFAALEAVIGHMKTNGHLGRCHLKGRQGDAANVTSSPPPSATTSDSSWPGSGLRLIMLTTPLHH
jgi:hypothetical protein